jgi:hypothetical protein
MNKDGGQWTVDGETICPYCKANGEEHPGILSLHPDKRMCGCDTCHSVFRYPSLLPFPTQFEGTPNGSAAWALVEFPSDLPEEAEAPTMPGVPKIRVSQYGDKRIATWEG